MDKSKPVTGVFGACAQSAIGRSTSLLRPRVIAFPVFRARASEIHPIDVVVPAAFRRRRCSVLPLRRGEAARRAVLLVKLRWLHLEIQALQVAESAQPSAR
jgi:hypothetical protein